MAVRLVSLVEFVRINTDTLLHPRVIAEFDFTDGLDAVDRELAVSLHRMQA